MDAPSLEKQKKGNLYVYKFSPITTASGGRTPDHHPLAVSVTKRIIPSSMWGFRKPKSKPKPEPNPTEDLDKEKEKEERKQNDGNENGNGNVVEERKSVSDVEGKGFPFPSPKEGKVEGGRKSVSHVENNMAYVGKFVEKPRKSTGAKLEINVESAIGLMQVKVLVTDMPGFMQVHAFQCARNTYDTLEKFSAKHLAYNLKKEFDKVYGPAWHCIVGSSFGSFVTHATGCFLYFSMEKLCILLFRTKVQRAFWQ